MRSLGPRLRHNVSMELAEVPQLIDRAVAILKQSGADRRAVGDLADDDGPVGNLVRRLEAKLRCNTYLPFAGMRVVNCDPPPVLTGVRVDTPPPD